MTCRSNCNNNSNNSNNNNDNKIINGLIVWLLGQDMSFQAERELSADDTIGSL